MIDHLLGFPDEATAQADPALAKYWIPASTDGPGSWRGDVCFPGIEVYQLADDGVTRTDFPGWHLIIALAAVNPALQSAGNGQVCILIADRDATVAQGRDVLPYVSSAAATLLTTAQVSPVPAGSAYSFGA